MQHPSECDPIDSVEVRGEDILTGGWISCLYRGNFVEFDSWREFRRVAQEKCWAKLLRYPLS